MRCRRYNYGEAATKPVVVIPSEARNLLFPFPFFVFLPARSHRRATSGRLRAWLRPGPETPQNPPPSPLCLTPFRAFVRF